MPNVLHKNLAGEELHPPGPHTHEITDVTGLSAALAEAANVANVKDFGAIGDGVADDTAAFQAALDAAELVIVPGMANERYNCGLVTRNEASTHLFGLGNPTIVQTEIGYRSGFLQWDGGHSAITPVDSIARVSVALQDTGESSAGNSRVDRLTLDQVMAVTKGEILKIVADDMDIWMDDTGTGEKFRQGEYAVAGLDSSGTTLTLGNRLLMESYTDNVRIARVNNYKLVIENITFDTSAALRSSSVVEYGYVISLLGGIDSVIKDCTFTNALGVAINVTGINTKIQGCNFKNLHNRPSKSRYGYGVNDKGWFTKMSDCHGVNVRHVYTNGGEVVAADSDDLAFYGYSVGAQVSNCSGIGCQGTPFDTHAPSYGTQFVNCQAYGSFIGALSGGAGFNARGRHVSFDNCEAINCYTGFGIQISEGLYMRNCRSLEHYFSGMTFQLDATVNSAVPYIKDLFIDDCYFENISSDGSNVFQNTIIGAASFPTTNVNIRNTTFKHKGTPAGGRVIDIFNAEVNFDGVTVDLTEYVPAGGLSAFKINASNCIITIKDTIVKAGGAAFGAGNLKAFESPIGSNTSKVRLENFLIKQDANNSIALTDGNLSDIKGIWQIEYGSNILNSKYISRAAVAAAVIDTSKTAEPVIFIKLTGSAGALSMANLSSGVFPGQIAHIHNQSNGVVSMTTPALAIAAGGFASVAWDGAAWRTINA